MSYSVEIRALDGTRTLHMQPRSASEPVSWKVACRLLQNSVEFRNCVIASLRGAPHEAYFWECPPLTRETASAPFEWILEDSPQLAHVRPDQQAFSEHLDDSTGIASFTNLGGDAQLIAPCRGKGTTPYAHLATFLRNAPPPQIHALFQSVGREIQSHTQTHHTPLWVSTSGLGVYWLHIRLDRHPKYYTHAPYRARPSQNP